MARRSTNSRDGQKDKRRNSKNQDLLPKKRLRYLDDVTDIDINDFDFVMKFVTETGKIVPARLTGATAKQQRQIKQGVRRARVMGFIA